MPSLTHLLRWAFATRRPEVSRARFVEGTLDQISGQAVVQLVNQRERVFKMLDHLIALLFEDGHRLSPLRLEFPPVRPRIRADEIGFR
jgi:hypothetical protein